MLEPLGQREGRETGSGSQDTLVECGGVQGGKRRQESEYRVKIIKWKARLVGGSSQCTGFVRDWER